MVIAEISFVIISLSSRFVKPFIRIFTKIIGNNCLEVLLCELQEISGTVLRRRIGVYGAGTALAGVVPRLYVLCRRHLLSAAGQAKDTAALAESRGCGMLESWSWAVVPL